jgi:hypothetical protein
MVFGNAKGRKIVEDLWPDVQWTTDEIFSGVHSPDWLFTHIRVTKLPLHLEETVPLAFASPDALGLAVAMALQRFAEPRRVVYYSGQMPDVKINIFGGMTGFIKEWDDLARSIFVEYVPAGRHFLSGRPESVN